MNSRKLLVLVLALTCVCGTVSAKSVNRNVKAPDCNSGKTVCSVKMVKPADDYISKKRSLENDLGLSVKQREELKQLRIEKERELDILQKQIDVKNKEIEVIKLSRIHSSMQDERITQVQKDIDTINKKMLTIKYQKQKTFESVLTSEQLKQYRRIKKTTR